MYKQSFAAATLICGLLAATSGHAALVAQWDLTGAAGSQASSNASFVAAGVSGGVLARGAGLTGVAAANSINASGWSNQASDYFSLSFNVDAGMALDLDTLFVGTRSSGTGPGTIGLFYSVDSFASAITTVSQAPGANFVNSAIDLSGLADFTGPVEFRFYQVGTSSAAGGTTGAGGTFRLTDYFNTGTDENLSLTGAVVSVSAVPLPPAVALMFAGMGVMGWVARRRKQP